ncbi:MAG: potassium transporter [Candidatus Hydrogenedentota bacterium]
MNYPILARYLGYFFIATGISMIPSLGWAVYFGEGIIFGNGNAFEAFLESILASIILGLVLVFMGRKAQNKFFQREALGLVGIGWIVGAALGALPYVFSGTCGPVDAYFESMSGYTTTGASIFATEDYAQVQRSIMFWRSFTHWLGGMGIIVLFIAVLPYLGGGVKQLFKSASPGPDPRVLNPRVKTTAMLLWKLYLGLTVLQTVLLMLAGQSFFEVLCHTFGTLATGGFSTRPASIGELNSLPVELIILLFMVLAGTNFGLYVHLISGRLSSVWKDAEWRVYIAIMIAATVLIAWNLSGNASAQPVTSSESTAAPTSTGAALRLASFQVVSVMTTTGYVTADFDTWPEFSRYLLLLLMFVGGCAGSTGGGIKVVRWIMLAKMAYWRVEATFRPKTIRVLRVGGEVVDESIQKTVYGFYVLFSLWFIVATLAMAAMGLPIVSAISAVAATLNNIGPGLELVGPMQNFAGIPAAGKLLLSLCMVLGRLELFTICVIFIPSFWRSR